MFGYPPFFVDAKHHGANERNAVYRKIIKGFTPEVRSAVNNSSIAFFFSLSSLGVSSSHV